MFGSWQEHWANPGGWNKLIWIPTIFPNTKEVFISMRCPNSKINRRTTSECITVIDLQNLPPARAHSWGSWASLMMTWNPPQQSVITYSPCLRCYTATNQQGVQRLLCNTTIASTMGCFRHICFFPLRFRLKESVQVRFLHFDIWRKMTRL